MAACGDAPGDGEADTVRPHQAVAAVGARGLVTAWSAGAQQLLGYAPAEVIDRPAALLLAPDRTDRTDPSAPPEAALRQAAAAQSWSGRVALRHRDGHRVEADLRAWSALDADEQPQWFLLARPPVPRAADGDDPQLVERAFARSPLTLAIYSVDGRIMRMNAATRSLLGVEGDEQVLGKSVDDLYGRSKQDGVPSAPAFSEPVHETMRRVAATNQDIRYEVSAPTAAAARELTWAVTMSPVTDPAGRVRGVFTAGCDITEQFEARQRLVLLNEAAARIGTTLDVPRTADELADIAVPELADLVSVDLVESVLQGGEPPAGPVEGGVALRRVAHRTITDGHPEVVVELGTVDTYPDYSPPARCLATGRPVLSKRGDGDFDRWTRSDPVRAARVRDYGFHSVMSVPVRARGTTLGVAVFARRRPEPFAADDLILADEMVARAAVCIDNARRYTRERSTALTLQRSLLPSRLPEQAAVEAAARYLPGSSRAGLGGDWFDVIPLSGARVALVVGDVVGHGIHASAAMGRLRIAVRTLADVDLAPDELLTQLDDLVTRLAAERTSDRRADARNGGDQDGEPVGDMGATCVYAVYDPVSRHCTVASAGGPQPAVIRGDGTADLLDLPVGPRLGLGGQPFEATDLELPENSLLALYTDGLIDTRSGDTGGLCRALSRPARSLEDTCDTVLETLLPTAPTDDVALLVARTRALGSGQVASWELSADPAVVAEARKEALGQLARWGLEEYMFPTELIVSELVTNAVRHAGVPVRLRLIQDRSLICEVTDGSNTAPHLRRARTFDEGGRGLFLIAQLSDRWGTRHTQTGKTIWAEQALPAA